jgi:hypothetical protein
MNLCPSCMEKSIRRAVAAIFDEHKGAHINLPAVVVLTMSRLDVTPENYATVSQMVANYVRNSPRYLVLSGKVGGVMRVKDMPKSTMASMIRRYAKYPKRLR